jgi:hypothetical protein
MITLWSYDNTTVPGGNNITSCNEAYNLETSDRDTDNAGIQLCTPVESTYEYCPDHYNADPRCQTGTGSSLWSHNLQENGIYDLNGNVYE